MKNALNGYDYGWMLISTKNASLTKEWNNAGTGSMNPKLSLCKKCIITNYLIQKIASIFFLIAMEQAIWYDNLRCIGSYDATLLFVSFEYTVFAVYRDNILSAALNLYSKKYPSFHVHLKGKKKNMGKGEQTDIKWASLGTWKLQCAYLASYFGYPLI